MCDQCCDSKAEFGQSATTAKSSNLWNKKTKTATLSGDEGGDIEPQAIMGDGEIQMQSLTGYGEGGVDVPPFAYYGIPPPSGWFTDSITGLYYPWHLKANSYSTNMGMESYELILPANTSSRVWTFLTNHYDLNGDPRAHEMRVVYKFANSGFDSFQVRLGSPTGTVLANLPSPGLSVLTTNTFIVPRIVGTNLSVYFIVYRNAAISYSPVAELICVQWQTYSGPVQNALKVKRLNPQLFNVSWSILNQQTNHWHLEYAGNILGPWASNTVPVTYSNWLASVNFTNNSVQRYYQLRYHWPGYH